MHRTKLLTLAACILGAAVGFSQASATPQEPPAGGRPRGHQRMRGERMEERVEDRLQRMSERLNLTGEQKEKIRPILELEAEQLRALRQDTSLSPEGRREKARQIRKASREQILPILTPEHKEKMKELARERREGEEPPPEKQ